MIDLTDRVAVVLGAGFGVGQATALTMARLGGTVAAVDTDPLAVAGTALLAELDGRIQDYVVDRWEPAPIGVIRQAIEADLGVPHILVAALTTVGPLRPPPGAGADGGSARDRTGPLHAVRGFLERMIRRGRGGRVVVVVGDPPRAADGDRPVEPDDGTIRATVALARQMAPYGILVNGVAAGPTDTPTAAARQALASRIPLRRLAHPDEIAAAVAFLASDQASFITGQVLPVNGGLVMHREPAVSRPPAGIGVHTGRAECSITDEEPQ